MLRRINNNSEAVSSIDSALASADLSANLDRNRLGRPRVMPLIEPSPLPSPIQQARFGLAMAPSAVSLLSSEALIPLSHVPTLGVDSSEFSLNPPLPLPAPILSGPRVALQSNQPVRIASPLANSPSGFSARSRSRSFDQAMHDVEQTVISNAVSALSFNRALSRSVSPSGSRSSSPPLVVTPPRHFRPPVGPVLGIPVSSMGPVVLVGEHSARELFTAVPSRTPEATPLRH